MKSIIKELWNGNIAPIKNYENNNNEIKNIIRLIEKNKAVLAPTLNEEQKTAFERYICCVEEYLSLSTEQAFCSGFSFGSKFLSEALAIEENSLI